MDETNDAVGAIADGVIRDTAGVTFDPQVHGVRNDGNPATKKDGTFRNKRRTGTHAAAQFEESVNRAENGPSPAALGVAVSRTFLTVCMMIGGEGWKPGEQEAQALDGAWAQYFEARGIEYVPPEALLLTALTAYAAPRLAQSKGPSRMKKWFAEKVLRRRANASANLWPNGERENQSRDEPESGIQSEGETSPRLRSV